MATDKEHEEQRRFACDFARKCILNAFQNGRAPLNADDARMLVKKQAQGVFEGELTFLAEADYAHILSSCTPSRQDASDATHPPSVAIPTKLPLGPFGREESARSDQSPTVNGSSPKKDELSHGVMGNFNVSYRVRCEWQVDDLTLR
jgi:hypothetical protein